MSFFFLNPWMLLGLLGIGLPILVHLLNRRRFDVVDWGAMQFLEWEDASRRRLRLQDLLLLLVRIGLILLITLVVSRPFVSGAMFWAWAQSAGHDVVLLVDGSTSVGTNSDGGLGFDRSRATARNFLDQLSGVDRISVFDVRRNTRRISRNGVDPELARSALEDLSPPLGTGQLASGILDGLGELRNGTHPHRDLVLVTDGQRYGWQLDDPLVWARLAELCREMQPQPKVWIVSPAEPPVDPAENRSLTPLELSRPETVAGYPVTISTTVQGGIAEDVPVHLEIDGHRLPSRSRTVRLPENGSAAVDFTQEFTQPGMHVVSVVIDDDVLPADNHADAVILVHQQLPVLLVDGDPEGDPTQAETYFAQRAFQARSDELGWVAPRVMLSDAWDAGDLKASDVLILANCIPETAAQRQAVAEFVRAGGGLFIALGDEIDPQAVTAWLEDGAAPLLPVFIRERLRDEAAILTGVHVSDQSLALPWLDRFRRENGGALESARFTAWYDVAVQQTSGDASDDQRSQPQVVAKLNTGSPFLISGRYGDGRVLLMTVPLDADDSTLPAKRDYVPLLHEVVFFLTGSHGEFNVEAGSPAYVLERSVGGEGSYRARGPLDSEWTVRADEDPRGRAVLRLPELPYPGVYRLHREDRAADEALPPAFAARHDPAESDLTPLSADERAGIEQSLQATFVENPTTLAASVYEEESQAELWLPLLVGFLGLMLLETWLTRRMVQAGLADPVGEEIAVGPDTA